MSALDRLIAETRKWREFHRARGKAGEIEACACAIRERALLDARAAILGSVR